MAGTSGRPGFKIGHWNLGFSYLLMELFVCFKPASAEWARIHAPNDGSFDRENMGVSLQLSGWLYPHYIRIESPWLLVNLWW